MKPINYKSGLKHDNERGIALITALMVTTMLLALGMAVVMSATTDTTINRSHRLGEQAFFAADGGLAVARRALATALQGGAGRHPDRGCGQRGILAIRFTARDISGDPGSGAGSERPVLRQRSSSSLSAYSEHREKHDIGWPEWRKFYGDHNRAQRGNGQPRNVTVC